MFSLKLIQHETPFGPEAGKWTRSITNEELADFCRCTVRAIQYAMEDLVTRGVVKRQAKPGGFQYSIPFEAWPELPDRPPAPKPVVVSDRPNTHNSRKLRAGQRSPVRPLPEPAQGVQYESDLDGVAVTEEVIAGKMLVTISAKECVEQAKDAEKAKGEIKAGMKSISPPKQRADSKPEQSLLVSKTDLHSFLDAYCLKHHDAAPSDKLLTKIQSALKTATLDDFKRVVKARMNGGKVVIPMAWFINLAEDAASAALRSTAKKPAGSVKTSLSAEAEHCQRVIEWAESRHMPVATGSEFLKAELAYQKARGA